MAIVQAAFNLQKIDVLLLPLSRGCVAAKNIAKGLSQTSVGVLKKCCCHQKHCEHMGCATVQQTSSTVAASPK